MEFETLSLGLVTSTAVFIFSQALCFNDFIGSTYGKAQVDKRPRPDEAPAVVLISNGIALADECYGSVDKKRLTKSESCYAESWDYARQERWKVTLETSSQQGI